MTTYRIAATYGMSSRWRSRLTKIASDANSASSSAQHMIEPSSPPQNEVSL